MIRCRSCKTTEGVDNFHRLCDPCRGNGGRPVTPTPPVRTSWKPPEGWCEGVSQNVSYSARREGDEKEYLRPKRVRCPVCRRYLIPQTTNVEAPWAVELQLRVPPHKPLDSRRKKRHFARSRDVRIKK